MSEIVQYPVVEIFSSFQGEGAFMGMPVTFVRFAGCNLRCEWCDEPTHKDPKKAEMMTVEQIVDRVAHEGKRLTILTGGEPCLQKLEALIEGLHTLPDMLVAMETNGTLPTPEGIDWVTCSPKAPEYLIHGECFFQELKYVVDQNFNVDCIPATQKEQCGSIWLQPCDMMLADGTNYNKVSMERIEGLVSLHPYLRAGIQLHKIYGAK